MTTTAIREQASKPPARPQPPAQPGPAIVTWAERAECTCPDHCDRDHEQD